MDQVVAAELVDETPKKAVSHGKADPSWHTYDFVNARTKALNTLRVDPKTQEELFRDGDWHMGHKPGYEYRDLHDDYMSGVISKEQFLEEYRNPDRYRPETPSSNMSGTEEGKPL